MQDAVNLGWKLAAVVRGRADPELLDTYHAERHPVGARVVQKTRAQTALTRPDPQTEALRETMADLIGIAAVNRRLGLMVTGLDIRYPLGDEIGHRIPDLDLPDGTRLYQHLHPGRPVLLGDVAVPGIETVPATTEPTLVRPDGHVAWIGSMGGPALADWFARHWRRERDGGH